MGLGKLILTYIRAESMCSKRQAAYEERTGRKPRRYEIMKMMVGYADSHHGQLPATKKLWKLFAAADKQNQLAKLPSNAPEADKKKIKGMAYSTFLLHVGKLEKTDKFIRRDDGVIEILKSHWEAHKSLLNILQ
jgi:hypothetical protein